MKLKKLINFCLLIMILSILISLNTSVVKSASFEAWNSEINGCSCDITTQKLFVFNTGTNSDFTISIEGEAKEWAKINEKQFFLNTGEKKIITIFYNIPCDASSKEISIKITSPIESILLNNTIHVGKCNNIQIIPKNNYEASNPCENLNYVFKVKNTESFSDTFSFESSKFNNDFQFIPQNINLGPNQEVNVIGILKRKCAYNGKFDFDIITKTKKNKQKAEFKATAVIYNNYSNSISVGKITKNNIFIPQNETYKLCQNTKYRIPVKINNKVNFNNKFILNVKSKDFSQINKKEIIVKKNDYKINYINYYPTTLGKRYIYLTSKTVLGNSVNKVRIPVEISPCYDININTPNKIKVNSYTFPINLENNGTKDTYVSIESDNTNFKIENNKLLLTKGEKTSINIDINKNIKNKAEKLKLFIKTDNDFIKSTKLTVIIGKPLFYIYKWFILIVIIILILLVLMILYIRKRNSKNFYIKSNKTNKNIKKIEKSVNSPVLDPINETKSKNKKSDIKKKDEKK